MKNRGQQLRGPLQRWTDLKWAEDPWVDLQTLTISHSERDCVNSPEVQRGVTFGPCRSDDSTNADLRGSYVLQEKCLASSWSRIGQSLCTLYTTEAPSFGAEEPALSLSK